MSDPCFYDLYCETEGMNVSGWAIDVPTECFNGPGHTISNLRMLERFSADNGQPDLIPNNFTTDQVRDRKNKGIDSRTDELIAQGFDYKGKTFSLSEKAQLRMAGFRENRSRRKFPDMNTIDDSDKYQIIDAADLDAMAEAMSTAIQDHVDSGTAIKDQVRAALTKADIEAIEDNR